MEYFLKRETFYLAINFLDRFLATKQNVQKMELQLIGVTCLYIAAKIEVFFYFKLNLYFNFS